VSVEIFADETQNYLVSVEQLEAARTPKLKRYFSARHQIQLVLFIL
jgi:hypothetical protein